MAPAAASDAVPPAGDVPRPVVAAVLENWPPHYSVTRDGRPTGFAIDVMNAVARLANLKVDYRIVGDWDQAMRLLQTGEVDLIPNLGRSPDRESWAAFTRPVETARISTFVRRTDHAIDGEDPLAGRVVGVVRGNIGAQLLEERMDLFLAEYETAEAALFALLAGQIDTLVYPENVVLSLARKIGLEKRIRVAGPPLAEVRRAIAVRAGNRDLLARLDRAVGILIGSPAYKEIFARWYRDDKPFWGDEEFLWGLVAVLLLVLVAAIAERYVGMVRMNRALVAAGAAREGAIEALRESESRYRTLIEGSDLAIMIALRNGQRVFANRAYADLLGYDSPEEILALPSGGLVVAPHDRKRVKRYREGLFAGDDVPAVYEFDAVRKDGVVIPVQAFVQRIRWNGEDAIQRTFVDLTERRRAEASLRESEAKFRHVFEAGGTGMFLRFLDGPIIQANEALADFLGVAKEDLVGHSILDFTVPEEVEEVRERMQTLAAGETDGYSVERRYVRKDGAVVWGIANIYTTRDATGRPAYVVATIRDITERKRAEEALAESEERFRSVFESGGAGIVLCDMDGHYVRANRAFCDLVGYTEEELIGRTPLALTHPDDVAEAKATLDGLRSGQLTRRMREKRYVRKDGGTVWAITCAVATRMRTTGARYWIGIVQDITERKLAEEALAESEARYRDLIQGFPLGIQVFSAEGKRLFANDAYARLVGCASVEEVMAAPDGRFLPAEDRERVRDIRLRVLSGADREVTAELDLVRRDGRRVPAQCITRRIVWQGRPAVQRTYIDLTERKQAEAALRASEERFRTVFEASGAGMVLTDVDGRYVRVNKAFCDLLGYGEDEIVGRTSFDFTHPDDIENTRKAMAAVMRGEVSWPHVREKRYLCKDGRTVWALLCVVAAGDRAGGDFYTIGIVQDITERKKAEQELADSRRRLLNAQRLARLGDWERDFATGRIVWSDETYRIFGVDREDFEVTYASFLRILVHPDDREKVERAVAHCFATGDPYSVDHRIVRPDGEVRIVHEEGEVLMGPDGEPVRFAGTVQDVTELRRAQQALEASEARFRGVFEAGGAGIMLVDESGRILDLNRTSAEFLAYTRDELLGANIGDIVHPEDIAISRHQRRSLFEGRIGRFDAERRLLRKDGTTLWVSISATLMREAPGAPPTLVGILQDITQRKESEAALAHKSRFLDLVRELTMAANQATHFSDAVQYCLDRICTFAGWPVGHAFVRSETDPEALLPMGVWHLDDPERFRPYCEATAAMTLRVGTGVPGLALRTRDVAWCSDIPIDPTRPTARTRAAEAVGLKSGFAAPVMVGDRVVAVLEFYATESVPRDENMVEVIRQAGTELGRVFEREEAETALLRRERQLRQIIDNVPHFIAVKDWEGRYLLANKALARAYGLGVEEIIGRRQMDLYPDKEEAARILDHDRRVIAEGRMVTAAHGRFHMADGSVRSLRLSKMPYPLGSGEVAVLGIAEDITELMRHEEERRRAQRMDALGKMTGGVAHDFNNLLTIILGNLQLLERRVADETLRSLVVTAERAARRGADVTRRLLAFARSQPLEPRSIDLNHLVRDMTALVVRLLGPGIRIETRLAPGLWQTRADPGQVEDALLNLVINARDAMPDGGRLAIETANATFGDKDRERRSIAPGAYVMVAVSDTGLGMSEEVLARAVEPFFTTKEVGKGSGLGLSMVYGFVRQSGGDVEIESREGKGTTVRLYLPRIDAAEAPEAAETEAPAPAGGRETVLLVEDNADVREFARYVLSGLDYRVIEAHDGKSALAALDKAGGVDVLFTDVVLPGGVSGPALARRVRERRPGIEVIFTSGNWDAADRTAEASAFLQKPYTGKDLAAVVRSVLDSRRRRGA